MPSPKEFYFNNLYPLQDEVLKVVAGCTTDFYLTGGTALSRFYLQHRFSDDLDFFVNDAANFTAQWDLIFSALKKSTIAITVAKKANDFIRITCSNDKQVEMKVDFVNDVPYHSGNTQMFGLFPRVDGWWNILSNKICALERREPKDVADILFLCKRYRFAWKNVFQEAAQKTTYIDPLTIGVILSEFPEEYLTRVQWISDDAVHGAYHDIQSIAKDVLDRKDNSLASQN